MICLRIFLDSIFREANLSCTVMLLNTAQSTSSTPLTLPYFTIPSQIPGEEYGDCFNQSLMWPGANLPRLCYVNTSQSCQRPCAPSTVTLSPAPDVRLKLCPHRLDQAPSLHTLLGSWLCLTMENQHWWLGRGQKKAGAQARAAPSLMGGVTALCHLQPHSRPAKLFIRQISNCHHLISGHYKMSSNKHQVQELLFLYSRMGQTVEALSGPNVNWNQSEGQFLAAANTQPLLMRSVPPVGFYVESNRWMKEIFGDAAQVIFMIYIRASRKSKLGSCMAEWTG